MDADDEESLGRVAVGGGEQTGLGTGPTSGQQTSHPTDEDDEQDRRPDDPVATAADVALEQDA